MKIFNRGVQASAENGGHQELTKTAKVTRNYPTTLQNATPLVKTADYTILAADLPGIIVNTGAAGTIVLTLPKAADHHGNTLRVGLLAAQIVRLLPQTGEAVSLVGSAVVTKYCQIAGVIGNYIDVYSNGTVWLVTNWSGVATKEP